MPRLQVLNGKRQGATFDVGRGETVVGHRNTANVAIDDPWVSWDHARIFFQGDSFWVEDLGSTNGTYVNCVRVKRERLSNEDIIFFGKTHVMFTAPELARAAAGTEPPDKERSDF
ncbi:FHA domain-containing protein [bacterium]|nr:FHA domain-containing protein [bacterium]